MIRFEPLCPRGSAKIVTLIFNHGKLNERSETREFSLNYFHRQKKKAVK